MANVLKFHIIQNFEPLIFLPNIISGNVLKLRTEAVLVKSEFLKFQTELSSGKFL